MKYLRTEFSLFLFHSLKTKFIEKFNVQDTKPESLLNETIYKKSTCIINITTFIL